MPQYQGVWNLAQQAQAQVNQQWVTDPLFDYTTLLLQADNVANGAQNNTFLDSSTANGGLGFPITRNGNTTQGTFSPFSLQPGEWSAYNAGSAAILSYPTGTYNFYGNKNCIEMWIYPTALTAGNYYGLLTNQDASGSLGQFMLGLYAVTTTTFQLVSYSPTPNTNITSTVVGNINQWNHIVFFIDGTTPGASTPVAFAINGVVNTATQNWTGLTASTYPSTAISLGGNGYFHSYFTGYMSNVRVVKASTYPYSTSNFNPPANPLTAITGTQVLLCQANRFYDANTQLTAKTITAVSGNIQAFSPFAPQYQYTPTVTGGSGYFDGTGDYLYTADNAALRFGAGNFTIEAVVYRTTSGATQGIIAKGDGGANTGWNFYITTANVLAFTYLGSNLTSTVVLPANSWVYVAVVRSGTGTNQTTLFINGVADTSATVTTNFNDTNVLKIASTRNTGTSGQDFWNGYIASLRMSNTNRTISGYPTAPLQSDANTTFLLNFTNAGILDATLKNNLETVGNAQVSTAVVKYGSGSTYYTGTGSYLYITQNMPLFTFGTGDFTVEFWIYCTDVTTTQGIWGTRPQTTNGVYPAMYLSAGTIRYYVSTADRLTGTMPLRSWTHVAVCRLGGVTNLYLNGVQQGSSYADTNNYLASRLVIGADDYTLGGSNFAGYIDDLRITKGIARYTRNFTPPQVALPRQ